MYKYKNKNYSSLRELADFTGIKRETIKYRLNKGMSLKEACSKEVRGYNEIIVRNKKFKSLNKAAIFYNIHHNTVRDRISKGWSVEEAFGLAKRKSCTTCKGKVYKITNSINNKVYIGITIGTLESRFNSHKYHARKVRSTKFHQAMSKIGIDKFNISLLKEIEDKYELHRLELKYINKYNSIKKGYNTALAGCSLDDKKGDHITYKGLEFVSVVSLAAYLNIPAYNVRHRIKAGIPLDKPVGDDRIKKIKYKGKVYNRKELADHLGTTVEVVKYRLENNMPLSKFKPKTS